jgi:hypothetical protein
MTINRRFFLEKRAIYRISDNKNEYPPNPIKKAYQTKKPPVLLTVF